jgi:hypothetical protein
MATKSGFTPTEALSVCAVPRTIQASPIDNAGEVDGKQRTVQFFGVTWLLGNATTAKAPRLGGSY